MSKTVEIFFDFSSPPSYLACTQMPAILERTGASVIWRPMFTIGLHDLTGNTSPVMIPNKGKWVMHDLGRYAQKYGVDVKPNMTAALNILPVMRCAAIAEREGDLDKLMTHMYPAIFQDAIDLSQPETLPAALAKAGLDADRYMELIKTPKIKDLLKANTQEAADRGAFGAPTFFIGDIMHFGQDRLHFVEEDLAS
jgi:2-hydroxychromene-2-carboxylate isomerase